MKSQIFISYRRDGGEALAVLLHDRLVAAGYRVFLDVESLRSGKFNEELLRVIDDCQDVLLVLPPGALDRCKDKNDWVRREIVHAINRQKNIIPVMMRGFTFPQILPEELQELPNYNGIEANMTMFPETVQRLMDRFLLSRPEKVAEKAAASGTIEPAESEVLDVSLDQELSAKFTKLFQENSSDPHDQSQAALSPIARMLAQKERALEKAEYVRSIEKTALKKDEIKEVETSTADQASIETDDSWHDLLDINSDGYTRVKDDRYFSLAEETATKNLVYVIRKKYDAHTLSQYYVPELTESTLNEENGETIRQYHIKNPDKHGNPLIYLRFDDKTGRVAVNMGFLDRNDVKLSREPMFIQYMTPDSDSKNEIRAAEVTTEHLTSEQKLSLQGKNVEEGNVIWQEADLQSGNIIIDPETGEPVLREPYYDAAAGCWKAKIKLRPGHQYFAFTVRPHSESPWLTPLEIGTFYSTGSHGFPYDVVKAAEYLERDNSADAKYQLALIFLRESEVQDTGFGKQLLEQAASEGSSEARLQIALDILLDICLRDNHSSWQRLKDLLGENNTAESAVGRFLRAFALETGILDLDPVAVDWHTPDADPSVVAAYLYAQSAAAHYLPAMLRLKCWDQKKFYYDPLRSYYCNTSDPKHTRACFSLACSVLYGQGFCQDTSRGLALLEQSAANGSQEAAEELIRIKC